MQAVLLDAASAAFQVGCASSSQFNREYSRMFGPHLAGHHKLAASCRWIRQINSLSLPPKAEV